MAALDKIGIKENMQRDLDGVELSYYCIITEYARRTIDMEGASNVMEAISECPRSQKKCNNQLFKY